VKVEPSPSPALSARTEPPCSSTRCRTTASPSRRAVRLPEAFEQPGQKIGPDPGAGVADAEVQVLPGVCQPHLHPAAARRELDRVREQVPHHLLEPIRVARDEPGLRVEVDVQREALCLCRRSHGFDPRLRHRLQRDRADAQPQLAGDRARDVEQVLDDPRLQSRAALDRFQGTAGRRGVGVALAQERRPGEDRREGGTQLVREDGEELVLGAVCRCQLSGQHR